MQKVAFVTYNTVGDNLSSGWHGSDDRRALLVQNTRGERWGAQHAPGEFCPGADKCSHNRYTEIDSIWGQLQSELSDLDHVVVYVGAGGSQRAVELASALDSSKVTFVLCDCRLSIKEEWITQNGMVDAGRVWCECGGHRTMKSLYENFMATGTFDRVA
jgi:hypothetical protein